MFGSSIVITKNDLKKLTYTESSILDQLIRDDFVVYDEMNRFDLSKLIEYRLFHCINNDEGHMKLEKNNATLKFLDNDKVYALNIEFENVDY